MRKMRSQRPDISAPSEIRGGRMTSIMIDKLSWDLVVVRD